LRSAPRRPSHWGCIRSRRATCCRSSNDVLRTTINHRLFVPSTLDAAPAPAPLIVALHGCTQTANDFAAGTRFDRVAGRAGAYVLYPEQSPHANPQRCWNWFLEEHQSRERGEPAAILALVDDVVAKHPIDPQRIFVAGLSAGGAMAAILAEQAPERFAAVGIMAGVRLHASRDLQSAYAAMQNERDVDCDDIAPVIARRSRPPAAYARLRATVWAGASDRLVAPSNASALARQFRELFGMDESAPEVVRSGAAEIERWRDRAGRVRVEAWRIDAMGHAWSGGSFRGSFTHPNGPRASEAMMAFFLEQRGAAAS
jgi:poly(hydroxyalkanoate) depolymerase family esterase